MTNNYYTKARTEEGILVFKTKEDFDEWRSKTKEGALLREIKPIESKEEKLIREAINRFEEVLGVVDYISRSERSHIIENFVSELKNFYKEMQASKFKRKS